MDLTDTVSLPVFPDVKCLSGIIPWAASGITEAFHIKALFCEEGEILLLFFRHYNGAGAKLCLPLPAAYAKEIKGFPAV